MAFDPGDPAQQDIFLIDLNIGLETQFVAISVYFLLTTAVMWLGVSRARSALVA